MQAGLLRAASNAAVAVVPESLAIQTGKHTAEMVSHHL
jgi:hypothetical protein